MYTAVVLLEEEREKLQKLAETVLYFRSRGYDTKLRSGFPLPHSMIVNMGDVNEKLNPKTMMQAVCDLVVDGFAFDHFYGICAARVHRAYCHKLKLDVNVATKQKYIPVAVKDKAVPGLANFLPFEAEEYATMRGFIGVRQVLLLGVFKHVYYRLS